MKQISPSAARNIAPIGDILAEWLPASGLLLEIASGTGEHGMAFARRFPTVTWQPSDVDESARASIAAWQASEATANYLPPLALDAASADWPIVRADAVLAINMVHISPWSAALGLIAGAARILPANGPMILYGPYHEADMEIAPSNAVFDHSLQARNPAWGLRSLDVMKAAAAEAGLVFQERRTMPANNLMLLFRKVP